MIDLEAMKAPRVLVELPKDEVTSQDEQETNRTKREAPDELRIETAVFVDDDMVTFIRERYPRLEVKETITDTVFAIMNGVRLLLSAPLYSALLLWSSTVDMQVTANLSLHYSVLWCAGVALNVNPTMSR